LEIDDWFIEPNELISKANKFLFNEKASIFIERISREISREEIVDFTTTLIDTGDEREIETERPTKVSDHERDIQNKFLPKSRLSWQPLLLFCQSWILRFPFLAFLIIFFILLEKIHNIFH
jgi:hypothetical protein